MTPILTRPTRDAVVLTLGALLVLVTAAVPEDVPEALSGARVDVMGGEVRRIR